MTESSSQPPQRRRFSRIHFPADVFVEIDGVDVEGQLVDISLHGALISLNSDESLAPNTGDFCRLNLSLTDDVQITMKLKIAHKVDQKLGCECVEIDLDSLTHLKRLVAYNIGDQDLLERQLGELIGANAE